MSAISPPFADEGDMVDRGEDVERVKPASQGSARLCGTLKRKKRSDGMQRLARSIDMSRGTGYNEFQV